MVPVTIPSARRGRHSGAGNDAIRIGLAIPLQGPGGIFGPSCEAVAQVYQQQVNSTSGLLGRPIEYEIIDAGQSPQAVARQVDSLIDQGRIDALTGWHISSIRQSVALVTQGRIPYAYTSLYEGGEKRPGVYCVGETPDQQIGPAMTWMRDERGLRRWHIVGSNYVWPRGSARATGAYARALGLEIRSTAFIHFDSERFDSVLRRLEQDAEADGVLMFLVGQDAVHFNRQFAARGLDQKLVRLTPLMEENMLLASGPRATRELYVAAGYFRSLATANSLEFLGDYTTALGPEAPPLNNQAESCYEGIQLITSLFQAAGSPAWEDVMAVQDGLVYDGPRGSMELHHGHLKQTIYLAKAQATDFDVLTSL